MENIYKPKSKYIEVKSLLHTLEYNSWGDPYKNISRHVCIYVRYTHIDE